MPQANLNAGAADANQWLRVAFSHGGRELLVVAQVDLQVGIQVFHLVALDAGVPVDIVGAEAGVCLDSN